MDGIRVHVRESELNARRRNMNGDREDRGQWAEGRQGHLDVLALLLLAVVLGYLVLIYL